MLGREGEGERGGEGEGEREGRKERERERGGRADADNLLTLSIDPER